MTQHLFRTQTQRIIKGMMSFVMLSAMLLCSYLGNAQVAIQSFNSTYTAASNGSSYNANGAQNSLFSGDSYTYKFGSSSGTTNNILNFSSFGVGSNNYAYRNIPNAFVKIRRNNNALVSGVRQLLWYQGASSDAITDPLKMRQSYQESMEIMFNGARGLNAGTDNIFNNSADGNGNNNNIERFDYIIPDGYTVVANSQEGFIVMDRGVLNAHDPFSVAVIKSLDGSQNPSSYTSVLKLTSGNYGSVNPIPVMYSYVLRKDPTDSKLEVSASTDASQGVGGVFIRYSDLGLANGTVIYGYSVFGGDFPAGASGSKVVDYTNATYFPTNTEPTNGGLDMLAVSGVFQLSNALAPLANDVTRSPVCNLNGTGQVTVPALSATDLNSGGVISSYKILALPSASVGVLYYYNGSTYVPASVGLELTISQSASLKFDPANGFSGDAVFEYNATNNFGLLSNIAYGTIPCSTLPVVSAGANKSICIGSSTSITATGAESFTWSPSTGLNCTTCETVVANPTVNKTYTITGTNPGAGCVSTGTITVSVNPLPTISGGSNATICKGGSTVLNPSGGVSYVWAPASTLSCASCTNPTASPTVTTTYTVTGTNANGCVNTSTVTVSVNALPTISGGAGVLRCLGTPATLTATGGVSYTWTPATGLSCTACSSPSATPSATTIYTVTGTGSNGCLNTATVTVSINALPSISGGSSVAVCAGTASMLSASGGTSYSWAPSTGLTCTNCASPTANPTSTTTYTVTGTNSFGCVNTANVTITVNPIPEVSAGSGVAICNGNATSLTATGASSYSWSPTTGLSCSNCANPTANPASSKTYVVTGTSGAGCSGTASVTVTVNAVPNINAGSNVTICLGASTNLTATGGTSYIWSPATGLSCTNCANPVANPAATTTYTVSGTNSNGCEKTATVVVSVNPAPSIAASGDVTICKGSSTTLSVSGTSSYSWAPSTGLSCNNCTSPVASPNITTTYTVVGTNAYGCTQSKTIVVSVNPLPTVSAGANVAICAGTSTSLNASGASSYSWSPSTGLSCSNCANPTASPTSTKIYTVTGTNSVGCVNTDVVTVTVYSLPTIGAGSNVATCLGSATLLSASGGTSYSWAPSTALTCTNCASTAANPTTTTIYTVTGTNSNGCVNTANVTVSVNQLPVVSAGANSAICAGSSTVLNATGAVSYVWTPTTGLSCTNCASPTAAPTSTRTYYVTGTSSEGCTGVASVMVTVNSLPGSIYGVPNVCAGLTTALACATSGGSWSSGSPLVASVGESTGVVSGLTAGTAIVSYMLPTGCFSTKLVTVYPSLTASATSSNVSCNSGNNGAVNLTVTGGTPTFSYHWNNGATTQNLTGVGSGTYNVTVTDANGCTATASKTISQPAALTAAATATNVNCNGGNNGTIDLTPAGGTTPYIYVWSNGASTQDLSGLSAGAYSVTVTDANGCTATTSKTITEPATLSASTSSSNALCFGCNNGTATLVVTGGTTPYTYNWSNGATTQNVTGLVAGSYSVTITDAKGCSIVKTFTITQPASFVASASGTNVNCFGGNNGTATLSVSGGTTPYTYLWSNGATTQNLSGLTAGTYSVTVKDANNYTTTASVTVSQPTVLGATATTGNVNCNGGSNGNIDVTVTGGTTPYIYSWSNGATTQDVTGLVAGTYSVLVTDAKGCTATVNKTITQPAVLAASATSTNVNCNGGSNGTIDLTVTGGTTAYTYNWSNGATSQDLSGLSAGTYSVVVTDAKGCAATVSKTITQPTTLAASATSTNVNCNGGNNGTIDLTPAGGTTPYTYVWSNGATSQDLSGLTAGTYSVTVTDAKGCTATTSKTITQPATLSATASSTNALCFGCANGTASLVVTGGTTPYSYNWSNGATTQNVTGLVASTYSVTITDANGCTTVKTVVITQPESLEASVTNTNVDCNGNSNGTADLTVTGGTTPYTYSWSNGATTEDLSGLSAGTYSVVVTDANGYSLNRSVTVTQPAALVSTASSINVSCFGQNNGSIDVTVAGGTTAYTYSWSNGATTQDLTGLAVGTYSVLVTDANGCTNTITKTITQPATLSATASSTNALCYGCANGTASLVVVGGTTPYTYSWSNGATTQNVTGLVAGTYSLTITDANGCTTVKTVVITQPESLEASVTNTNVDCNGNSNGTADLTVTGGTTPYTYLWSNGATSQDLSGLSAGTYSVVVTDANGYSLNRSVTVTQPATLVSTASSINVSCFGQNNGSIDVTVTGGTTAYTYSWSNGATTQDLSGLAAGTYIVTVTDAKGCTATTSKTITQPATLSATASSTNALCFGCANGTASLVVAGGTTPYTYSWSNGATTQNVTGLVAGTYSVTITDANGCTTVKTVVITQPESLEASVTNTNVDCNGNSNGTADLTVTGGTTPYTYLWSNGATSQDLSGLAAGTYSVVVTDANGYSLNRSVTVTQPATLVSTASSINVSCFGQNNGSIDVTVAGGTTAYTYSWSNGATTQDLSGLAAGTYSVLITDANGCTNTITKTITQPATLSATASSTNALCFGCANGTASLVVVGGTTPYTYNWSNGATTQNVTGLVAGTYSVTITDANGCTTVKTVVITQPESLEASVTNTNVDCNGNSNGTADLTVTGGTTPYTYIWSNGATSQDLSGLSAGTYSVVVTDANGYSLNRSVTVTQPATLVSTASSINVSCFGQNNGSIDVTVAGGTTAYTYSWSNGATTQDLSGLAAGTYSVLVTDANGCTNTITKTITQPATLSATASSTNALCFGCANGTASLVVVGGTTPYTYNWSNVATTQNVTGLVAGTYSVTITDANGCTTVKTVVITQPESLEASVTNTNVDCNGNSNGTADLTVTGGTTPYTYLWSNGATSQDLTGLAAGTYSVVVTDANGYSLNRSVTVTQPATLVSTASSINVSCFGQNNGSIDVTVAGGTTAYTYNWSNGATTQDITGLAAGTYSVLVTDANGCTNTITKTITQPATLSATASSTNALCFGCANGTASLVVAGGTTPYTFNWSNGATTQNVTGLVAGTYSVTVTDANGCTTVKTVVITQPESLEASVTNTNVDCNGNSNGTADLTVTGGTTPYTYLWSNGATSQDLTGLAAGTYSVVVTDANGYTLNRSVTVTQPATLVSTATSINVSCFGQSNGSIDVTVAGGTTPYTYSWSNGATTQDLSGLAAGTYSVLVTDANGCTNTITKTITQPATLSATASSTNALCFGCANGTASLVVAGGTTPYTYNWSNGATTQNVTGLVAGSYSVTITDAKGCTTVKTVVITQPESLEASVTNTNVDCNGNSNGTADLTVTGGTTPYTYSWSNGATTEDLSGLSAGTYSVVVTDANGYSLNRSVTVTQPATLVSTASSINVSCNGQNNGSIDVAVAGGTTAYTYSWSNGATSQDLSGLAAGTYSVLITDANGCTNTITKTITQPATLSATASSTNALCFGCANGTASMVVTGGTTPYSYNWSNGATTQNVTGLVAGTYSVTITDANGCTTVKTVVITQPESLEASVTNTNVDCNGNSNGTADLTVTGGTTPYTYSWSNGATTEDLSGLSAGTYSVVVTDANGYSLNRSVTVSQPATLVSTATSINVSCFGQSNGSIDVTVAGGTTAYTYNWSNGATTQDLSGLAAGTYSVLVTDANGCTNTITKTITQPATLSATASSTNALCFGCANGTASLVVTGGTTPYSYNWSNGATTQNVTGLVAGTYSVTITDANGCTTVKTVVITQPESLEASVTNTNVDCNGNSNGTADLTVTGGTTPYTYLWSNGATIEDLSGLSAGTYSVVVTDANGYSLNRSVTVTQPATLVSTASSINVSCFGQSNGSIDVTVAGGTTAYTYSWSNGATSQDLSGLAAGTYSVLITDANGCTNTITKTITQPATLSATASSTNALCFGCANGTASLVVTGGTTPYSYNWSNGATTQNVTGLVAGTYSVTITDANGCTTVKTVVITQPESLEASVTNTNVDCNGNSNGTADLTVIGGTTPYTYIWSNGATSQDLSGLSAGTYSVVVTDANGYSLNRSVTVTQPATLVSTASSINVSCFGQNNGSIDVTVAGGTTAYTYSWSNGATSQDVSGLAAGAYSVLVTDANGCTNTITKTITQPATLSATASSTNALCFGCANGTASLVVAGGTTPYTYNWSNGATTQNVTGLVAGTYSVTITDANGCTTVKTVVITQPESLEASVTNTNVDCNGNSNGTADLTVTGGTTPYTYLWSNGATSQDLTGLAAGTYSVVVTDANGYSLNRSVTVTQPATLVSTASSINVSCFGQNNGSIDVTVAGGTTAYTYSWSNGATTQDLTGLAAGTYSVLVTDANGCTNTITKTITQPATLSATASSTNALCFACANGTASLVVAGGTTPYTYNWSNGATTQNVTGLLAGTYSVTITDANGCTTVKTVVITQPESLEASVTNTNVDCNGNSNGTADLTVTGGTTPYTYSWSNGATTQDLTGLAAGTYSVVVTDANGYSLNRSVTVTQPATLVSTASSINVSCFGQNNGSIDVTVAGGTTAYTYSWSNGATSQDVSGLAAGTYSVLVTDANGCTNTITKTITQPATLSATASSTNALCFGCANGTASLVVVGGTTPYTYNWSNGATTQNVTGLVAGTYSVTITDANGCTTVKTVVITQPESLEASVTNTNVDCNGNSNGTADLTVTGGTTPYTYLWSNGATSQDLSGLAAGTYSVVVTDANGYSLNRSVTVTQPAGLAETCIGTNIGCNGAATGAINLTITGGTTPYSYVWSNGATTEDLSGLVAGTYSVLVTDAHGCTLTKSYTITEPSAVVIANVNTSVSCNGANSGSIDLTVTGGTAPYTYLWNTGATTQDLSGLAAGTYSVTVKDGHFCTSVRTYTITQPTMVTVAETKTNVLCNGGSNGAIDITVAGGVAPYTYSWSNGATTEDVTGLTAGTYAVAITDANGCIENKTYTISEPAAIASAHTNTNVSCNGGSNGAVAVVINGGVAPYTYSWNTGAATSGITGLAAGTYSLSVTDANGCAYIATYTVSEPAVLTLAGVTSDVSCNGGNNGAVDVTVGGGVAPYSYVWSNGAGTQDITGLTNGTYNLAVTDANGCSVTGTYTITQPAPIGLSATTNTVVCGCLHGMGEIYLDVTGGTAPFTYSWSNGSTTKDDTGLWTGTYTVLVTDANGCTATDAYSVISPVSITMYSDVTNVGCHGGNNGAIAIALEGGIAPYTYSWSTGATTSSISGLTAGTYSVTYTDANGCSKTEEINIIEPASLLVAGTAHDVTCHGGANGTVELTVTGGTEPYSYNWSNGATTEDASGLTIGSYSVVVTDANGCTQSSSFSINQPAPMALSATTNHVICGCLHGMGEIYLTVTGGAAPYTFLWSNGSTDQNDTGLWTGTYTVLVTDNNGCTATDAYSVVSPESINIYSDVQHVGCFGGNNGRINLAVSGGIAPYTYHWSTGATTQNVSGLVAGTYSVAVTDANGCEMPATFTVTEPGALYVTASHTDITCYGGSNGAIDVTVTGGTAPYSYSWSNGATTQDISGVVAGTYVLNISDANGCTRTATYTITQDESTIVTLNGPDVVCIGSAVPFIGTPATGVWSSSHAYRASVTSSGIVTGLALGTTNITYTGASGCYQVVHVTVNNAIANITGTRNVCVGQVTDLHHSMTGGTWSSSDNTLATVDPVTGVVTGVSAGIVTITYNSSAGCYKTVAVTVKPLPEPIGGADSVCVGLTTLMLNSGGNTGTWSGSNNTFGEVLVNGKVRGISAGTVTVSYRANSTGCFVTRVVTVNGLPEPIVNSTSLCPGSTATLTSAPAGGTWISSNDAVASIDPLTGVVTGVAGGMVTSYMAVVTYTLPTGCVRTTQVTVNSQPGAILGPLSLCVGSLSPLSSGSTGCSWSSSNPAVATISHSGLVSALAVGTTTIVYTNGGGCTRSAVVTVNATLADNSGEAGVCTGMTTTLSNSVTGGTWSSSYTYNASVNMYTGVVTGAHAGTAIITYRISAGCFSTTEVTVYSNATAIAGTKTVCIDATTALSYAYTGGTWSSSSPRASVNPTTGVVTGVSNGTAIITYTMATGCYKTAVVTVSALPTEITGSNVLCAGSVVPMANITTGGFWTSSNTAVATVGSGTGFVTGISAGIATITYQLGSGCYAARQITVNTLPGNIIGAPFVCQGQTTALGNEISGGVWSTSNTSVAPVSVSGVVSGSNPGVATITYTLSTGCRRSVNVTVGAMPESISGTLTSCAGGSTTLSSGGAAGTWSSSNMLVAHVGSTTGIVAGVATGTTVITFTNGAGCFRTAVVTVTPLPAVAPINGESSNLCVGTSLAYTNATYGGVWNSSNETVVSVSATGVLTANSVGTATISYSVTSSCGTSSATRVVTVISTPSAGTISGPTQLCVGSIIPLVSSVPGGLWSNGTPEVAITCPCNSGQVTGISQGVATISYTVTNACGTAVTTYLVTVNPVPTITTGIIAPVIEAHGNASMSYTTTGAPSQYDIVWSSEAITAGFANVTGAALISSPLTITVPVTATEGTYTASIRVHSGSCVGTLQPISVTVNSSINIYTFAGTGVEGYTGDNGAATLAKMTHAYNITNDCNGNAYIADFENAVIRKVSPTGVITTIAGNGAIGYSGDGGPATAATMSHPYGLVLDAAGNLYFSDYNNHVIRKVSTSGIITRVAGTAANGFAGDGGPALASKLSYPSGLTIDGAGNLYIADNGNSVVRKVTPGGTITTAAGNSIPGYSGDGGPATAARLSAPKGVHADGSGNIYVTDWSNQVVRKIDATGTISTVAGNGITGYVGDGGPATAAKLNHPVGITTDGAGNVYFTEQGNHVVRKVNASGIISTIAGNSTPGYSGDGGPALLARINQPMGLSRDCAGHIYIADNANLAIRILGEYNRAPYFVNGATQDIDVCTGATFIALNTQLAAIDYDTLQPATWTVVTAPSHGTLVAGYSATTTGSTLTPAGLGYTPAVGYTGADAIVVRVSDGIASATTTINITVSVPPVAGVITGATAICGTGVTHLFNTVAGGTWSSSNAAIATVNSGGYVTGTGYGTAHITYTVTNACGSVYTTTIVTYNATPFAGSVIGAAKVCRGSSLTFTATVPGGVWTSGNTALATVSPTGLVYGVDTGIATISYAVTNACGTAYGLRDITVEILPVASPIVGPGSVCAGASVTFTDGTPHGAWYSSNTSVATVGIVNGIITGVSAGTALISYVHNTSCGVVMVTKSITVNPSSMTAPAIAGPSVVCAGANVTLTNGITGGTWSSVSYPVVLGVGSTSGIVTGVTAGTAIVTYTVAHECGISYVTKEMTVAPQPTVAPITGTMSICSGWNVTASNATPGGIWSSSNNTLATVNSAGVITGIAGGMPVISYSVSNSCGTISATALVPVGATPAVAAVTGASSVCVGSTSLLSNTTVGGTWYTPNTTVAAVNSAGIVTGVGAGTALISYSVHNGCGYSYAVKTITVNPLPVVASISGLSYVCVGADINMTDAIPGGVWSSSNGAVATVNAAGVVTGVGAGITTISYAVTNGCGTVYATKDVNVQVMFASIYASHVTSAGAADGCALLTVTGGVADYTYLWSNGATTQNLTGLAAGTYSVLVTDSNGDTATASVVITPLEARGPGEEGGAARAIYGAHPNPFVSQSIIRFNLPEAGMATIDVFNAATGAKVATVFNDYINAGEEYTATIDGMNLPSGVYVYRIATEGNAYLGKVILVK